MNLTEKIKAFKDHQKKMHAYNHAMGLLNYDAATTMPPGAMETLGDTLEILSGEIYNLTVDPEYKTLLHELNEVKDQLDFQTRREVEHLLEKQEKMEKVPKEEVMAAEAAQNEANYYWEVAKKSNDFSLFAPYLQKMIDIKKRYAGYINPDGDVYDTLMNEFEEGMTQAQMDPFFDALREKLVPLIAKVAEAGQPDVSFLETNFDIDAQRQLSEYVMDVMGVDKNRCILRETEHPFTTQFSKNDVRITTKYIETELASNFTSVIHESGHGMYELSIGDELLHSVLGEGASTAIHESQSRLWENNIGRSLPFVKLVFPKIKELFPKQMDGVTAEQFHRGINVAKPTLIRVDADELTYALHVMVRYEIEKKIFKDQITVEELPAEWNRLYKEYLGIDVPDDTHGVLQDAHWVGGAFGYFPSYALGSAYSAQIMAAILKEVDVWACCDKGDFSEMMAWLTEKLYRHGMLYKADELIQSICGEPFDPSYYVNYLTDKFTALYNL